MKIKIVQNKEIRVWKYPKQNKYKTLLKFIAKTFGLTDTKSYSLQYLDDEDDSINIRNDNDIDDAIAFAKEERRKSLKIFLISSVAMDSFLDDALSDFFNVSVTVTPSPNITKKIAKPNIGFIPSQPTSQKKEKEQKNGMNPEDILNSMLDENVMIENTVNGKLQKEEKSKSRLPKVENKMSPDDILNSMVMDMNDLNFSPQKSRQHHMNLNNKSPQKPMEKNGNDYKVKSDDDFLKNLLNDDEAMNIKSDNLLKDEASKIILNKSMPNQKDDHTESDDLLKQILTENERNEVKKMQQPMVENDEESDDLLQELLNNSDDANLPKLPSMDAQNIINSIVNPQINDENEISDLQLNEQQSHSEDTTTEIAQIPYTQHNGIQQPGANEQQNMKKEIPLQPTIQSKVPPTPFLQPYHSQSPVGENVDGYIQNRGYFASSESEKLALLAQFNAVKVPQHDPHKKEQSEDKIDDDDEHKKEPDPETLDEIRQCIDNPTSIHDVNMAQMQTDLKREKLLEPMKENNEMQEVVHSVDESEEIQNLPVEIPTDENQKVDDEMKAIEHDDAESPDVDVYDEDSLQIAEDENDKVSVIEDEDGIEQNAEPSESDPVVIDGMNEHENENNVDNENEIDEMDMDFEDDNLKNKDIIFNEDENLKIAIDESIENENIIIDDLEISPMEESHQSKNEDEHFPNTHVDNQDQNDDEIEKINENNSEPVIPMIPPSNDLIADEIFIGIDPANFNQSEDEEEPQQQNEDDGNDDDDESMDLTQTTPDPIPQKGDVSNLKHPECDVNINKHADDMDIEQNDEQQQIEQKNEDNSQNSSHPKVENQEENKKIIEQNANNEIKVEKESNSNPTSPKAPLKKESCLISADLSPRDQRRLNNKLLREEQREKEKQQKLIEKKQRMEERKKIKLIQKQHKDEEKLKRLQQKQLTNKSKKFEKLRRQRNKELEKLKQTSEGEIFTTNKNWYPIKFILDTQSLAFEFENYADLIQIIELQSSKQYRVYPSFVECVFDDDNIHCPQHKLPSNHHCIVYIYYNWRSVQNINYQSVNLLLYNSEEYIPKINVFRIPPWINTKSSQKNMQNDGDVNVITNPNEIYSKCLDAEILKAKMSKRSNKSSPFSLFKLAKQKKSDSEKQIKPSLSALLPENCEQTPNFRWKFDLTQDYSLFDPLLNDEILCNAMHEYEIYFVQIRSNAVIGDLSRIYDVFVIYLNRCEDDPECIDSLLCNLPKMKKSEVYSPPYKNEIELFLLQCVDDEQFIVDQILSYLKYRRCYGFVTIAKNTSVGIKDNVIEEIVFHYGSIGDWLKCAIVGKDDFDKDLKKLQKCGKWTNQQHLSLIAFLNSIHSGTYKI